jgi:hypothetical protein
MKSGGVGMFEEHGGRVRWPPINGEALSRQGIDLSQNLNKSY